MSGRKRHLLVATGGLVLKALVPAANVTDRLGSQQLGEALNDLAHTFPRLRHLWVDSAYQGSFKDWGEPTLGTLGTLGWTVAVVKRPSRWVWVPADQEPPEAPSGLQVLPRRWVVEGTQPHYQQDALDVQERAAHYWARRAA